MAQLEPIVLRDWRGGVVNSANSFLAPQNSLKFAINMVSASKYGKAGSLQSRWGVLALQQYETGSPTGLSLGATVEGLFSPTDKDLIVVHDNKTYYTSQDYVTVENIGSTPFDWDGRNLVFKQFIGYTFATNGYYIKSWDGNTANDWGATNLSSAPTGTTLEIFQGRLYVAGQTQTTYGSGNTITYNRIYFSSLVNASNNITWDTTNDYIDVEPDDLDQIICLKKVGGLLYVIKQYSTYVWDGTSLQFVADVGATSERVVEVHNNNLFFLSLNKKSPTVYQIPLGGTPIDIGGPVKNWFIQLVVGRHNGYIGSDIFAPSRPQCAWIDDGTYYISLAPNIQATLSNFLGVAENDFFSNIILGYNIDEQSWEEVSIEKVDGGSSSITWNFPLFATKQKYTSGTDIEERVILSGYPCVSNSRTGNDTEYCPWVWNNSGITRVDRSTEDKTIYKPSTTYEYEYFPIWYYLQTQEMEFGSASKRKNIGKFAVYVDGNYESAQIQVRVDGGSWKDLSPSGFSDKRTEFSLSKWGYTFEFRIFGQTVGEAGATFDEDIIYEPFIFEGFEFFEIEVEDYNT